eukprot:tig00001086_g6851.t1
MDQLDQSLARTRIGRECAFCKSEAQCPDCFGASSKKARQNQAAALLAELQDAPVELQTAWMQRFTAVEQHSRPLIEALGARELSLLMSRLVGVSDQRVATYAADALSRLVSDRSWGRVGAYALEHTEVLQNMVKSLRTGVTKLRLECVMLARALAFRTEVALDEALYASGLLEALAGQLALGPDRLLAELDGEGAFQTVFFGPACSGAALRRYAPRLTARLHEAAVEAIAQVVRVACTAGDLRARIAALPGLVPALLEAAARPCPQAYPEDRIGHEAAQALRLLLAAPPSTPAAARGPPRPPLLAPGGRRRMLEAGEEGLSAGHAAARAAQAAVLAARDGAGRAGAEALGAALEGLLTEDWRMRMRYMLPAREICLGAADGPQPDDISQALALASRSSALSYPPDVDGRRAGHGGSLGGAGLASARAGAAHAPERGGGRQQARELAGCLGALAGVREHAGQALGQGPVLRRALAMCAGPAADHRFKEDLMEASLQVPLGDGRVTGFAGSLLQESLAALQRLAGAFPGLLEKLYEGDAEGARVALAVAAKQAAVLKERANEAFARKELLLAAQQYALALAVCPPEAKRLLAACLGNLAECELLLGGAPALALPPAGASAPLQTSSSRPRPAGRRLEMALLAARESLRLAEAAGEAEGTVATKARLRIRRAEEGLAARAAAAALGALA